MTRDEKLKILGNRIGRGFTEETKLLGHVWTRNEFGRAICAVCGCAAKDADERWKAPCPESEP